MTSQIWRRFVMCDSAALRLKHGCCPSQHSWLHDRTMQGDDDNDDALLAATTAAWGNPQAAWHTTGAEARVPPPSTRAGFKHNTLARCVAR